MMDEDSEWTPTSAFDRQTSSSIDSTVVRAQKLKWDDPLHDNEKAGCEMDKRVWANGMLDWNYNCLQSFMLDYD